MKLHNKSNQELAKILTSNKQRQVLNFLNLHDVYQFNKEPKFKKSLLEKQNINLIDGFIPSLYLSIINLKKISRTPGPIFTRHFLSNPKLSGNKKHFFIGLEKEDLKQLQEKFPHLKKVSSYNPPFIKDTCFPPQEIEKISKLIDKEKPDYIWVGMGCPKQNLITSELFKKTKTKFFINSGAAIDFFLGKKKEAPRVIKNLGIEWLYRLITDFKYSRKKVWRHFKGLFCLPSVKLEK